MPAITASAPGKAILFGEHAVVYGRPAIAVPVSQVRATAIVTPNIRGSSGSIFLDAPDIELQASIQDLPADNPLARAVQITLAALGAQNPPAMNVRLASSIPVAAGLGSGAAASVALIRSVSTFLGKPLSLEQVSALAFEIEKIYHGTPSGIDNTVVSYAQPVYFIRGQPVELLKVPIPFTLVIGDTGVRSPTAVSVSQVRAAWHQNQEKYEELFDQAAEIAVHARQAIESGQVEELGPLMDANQLLLEQIGVSSPELDKLIQVAKGAGAWGAKLSGGGRGGNMIALVEVDSAQTIAQALKAAGASRVLISTVH
jgi:mevalonate kinase